MWESQPIACLRPDGIADPPTVTEVVREPTSANQALRDTIDQGDFDIKDNETFVPLQGASPLGGIPVDEDRIAKPGPDGEHRPFLDVLHGGHLAQPLYHVVVVHHDRRFELPNLGDGLK